MTQGLARYHARLPRYILSTEDDSLIRVAGPKQTPWEEGTEIKNVSLTGLAFVAPDDLCPILGEVVKIQFTPPGAKQVACYGIVTRLEDEGAHQRLVGLHFYKMEMAHRIALAQGLAKKFKGFAKNQENLVPNPLSFKTFFFFSFALLCWLEALYLFISFGYIGLFNILKSIFS